MSASPCYRHSGKARRGDGNDVTPNPSKLYATGKELRKLARLICAMCPPGELPTTIRARSLREKNKYASRICRLKKKAQHEANKIKLHGLEQEHRMYMLFGLNSIDTVCVSPVSGLLLILFCVIKYYVVFSLHSSQVNMLHDTRLLQSTCQVLRYRTARCQVIFHTSISGTSFATERHNFSEAHSPTFSAYLPAVLLYLFITVNCRLQAVMCQCWTL